MTFLCPAAGQPRVVRSLFAAALAVVILIAVVLASGAGGAGHAADRFPFDRDLLLDVAPMRPAKRVPILNVAADGAATIDLWCKTVRGFVQLGDDAIRIESGPLPEAMPQFMAAGQCTPARIQADYDMLAALAQVTTWRRAGNAVVLSGSATLRFRLSDH